MTTALAHSYVLLNQLAMPDVWLAKADDPPPPPKIPSDFTSITASPPPGSGAFVTILQWGLWVAFAFCIGGVLKASGGLAWAGIGRGGSGDHGAGLGWAIVGTILCGSVGTIVTLVA